METLTDALVLDCAELTTREINQQLKALPDSRVEGLSGNLGMGANQRIERQLPWAQFVGGQVQRLPNTTP